MFCIPVLRMIGSKVSFATPPGRDEHMWKFCYIFPTAVLACITVQSTCFAFQPPASASVAEDDTKATPASPPAVLADLLKEGTPLNQQGTIVLDKPHNRLLLKTEVACNNCLLEMFCCLKQTKEHESILSLDGRAHVVHIGLLALGMQPGKPVTFTPEFKPPSGQTIKIFVNWVDTDGRLNRCDGRDWMQRSVSRYYSQKLPAPPPGVKLPLMELRFDPYNKEILWFGQMNPQQRDKLLALWDDANYRKAIQQFYKDSQPTPMDAEFVFAGSYQYTPEGTNEKLYAAEGGQLVCVANFASSTIDVREASSADDGVQSYEAKPDKVPPRGTPVIVELVPVPDDAASAGPKKQ